MGVVQRTITETVERMVLQCDICKMELRDVYPAPGWLTLRKEQDVGRSDVFHFCGLPHLCEWAEKMTDQ